MSGDGRSEDRVGEDRLRALIEGERQALAPSARAQKATWSRVAASVATPALMPVRPAGAGCAGAATASVAPWAKIVLALSLGGGGLAYAVGTQGPAQTLEAATRASASRPDSAEVSELARALQTLPQPPEASVTAVVPPTEAAAMVPLAPRRPSKPMALRLPAPWGAGGPASRPGAGPSVRADLDRDPRPDPDPSSALAEEARLLGRARRALRTGDYAGGLTQLASHEARFSDGQLTEDRLALRARILCESGDRSRGRRAADALAKAFPGSSHLARLGRLCVTPSARQ